jgi:hypothetical protein
MGTIYASPVDFFRLIWNKTESRRPETVWQLEDVFLHAEKRQIFSHGFIPPDSGLKLFHGQYFITY